MKFMKKTNFYDLLITIIWALFWVMILAPVLYRLYQWGFGE